MSACATKTVFYSKGAARAAGRRAVPRLYWYVCPDCGNYHLTKLKPGTFERREHVRKIVNKSPFVKW